MRSPLFLTAATFAAQAVALPAGDGHKGDGKADFSQEAKARADAVKAAFQTAWDGYYEYVSMSMVEMQIRRKELMPVIRYAFPNDELSPVDNTFSNSR